MHTWLYFPSKNSVDHGSLGQLWGRLRAAYVHIALMHSIKQCHKTFLAFSRRPKRKLHVVADTVANTHSNRHQTMHSCDDAGSMSALHFVKHCCTCLKEACISDRFPCQQYCQISSATYQTDSVMVLRLTLGNCNLLATKAVNFS